MGCFSKLPWPSNSRDFRVLFLHFLSLYTLFHIFILSFTISLLKYSWFTILFHMYSRVIQLFIFWLFSVTVYRKIYTSLSYIVNPCCLSSPCMIVVPVNLILLAYHASLSLFPLITLSLFSVWVILFLYIVLLVSFRLYIYKLCYKFCLTSLSIIFSRSVHIAANGSISFILMAE